MSKNKERYVGWMSIEDDDVIKTLFVRFLRDTEVYETNGGPMSWEKGDIEEGEIVYHSDGVLSFCHVGWG